MIERALRHAGQVAASALVAAVLIGTGLGGLSPQPASDVAAGALAQTDARRTVLTPTVSGNVPAPALIASSLAPIPLADDVAHAVRVAPHLEAVEPKTAEVGIHTAILMSFSQRMNRQSVEASFLI